MKNSMIVLAALASLTSAASASDLNNGLVGFFPFEGTPYDAMHHDYAVTPVGTPTYERGAVGRAIRFHGNDALMVDHAGALSFDLDIQSYTIAFYCRLDNNNEDQKIIQAHYSNQNLPTAYNFGFVAPEGIAASNSWYGSTTGTGFVVQTSSAPFVQEWRHVAIVYDHVSGLKKLFVDGLLVDTEARPNEPFNNPNNTRITIGAAWGSHNNFGEFYAGLVDDLRIYNRVLTTTEVNELVDLKPCPPDFNGDGFINGLDLDGFAEQWESGVCK